MLGKITDAWTSLSEGEKVEVVFFLSIIAFAVIAILLAMAWSRGREVEMLKDRMVMMEDRFNVAEKSRFALIDKTGTIEQRQTEQANKIDNLQIRSAEMERWMEEYNKLPQLPKPKPVIPNKITPLSR